MMDVNKILGNKSSDRLNKILGKKTTRKQDNNDFEGWIQGMKNKGYTVYQDARCPDCNKRAVSMHSTGVIHSKCSSCNWGQTGFGGPNTHSWGEAVRRTHGAEGARFVESEKRAGRY